MCDFDWCHHLVPPHRHPLTYNKLQCQNGNHLSKVSPIVVHTESNIYHQISMNCLRDLLCNHGRCLVLTAWAWYMTHNRLVIRCWMWFHCLTLYVLNFSEGTKTYICILCHPSTLIWHRYLKSFLKYDQDLYILHSQYHGCWCPGDVRSQGISSHDIDLFIPS